MSSDHEAESGAETVSGYWKQVFAEHPHLVRERSNEELYQIYLRDHPGETEVPKGAKNGLSNVKSQLRKERKNGRRKRGRPKGSGNGASAPAAAARPARPARSLETLEEHIDECLSLAKSLGQDALEPVVHALRKARNLVIMQEGS